MRLKALTVLVTLAALGLARPDLHRPVVTSADGERHVAGQLIIQLSQSQRGLVHPSNAGGIALFGISSLDRLCRRWRVNDITPLMLTPNPSTIATKHGCELQYVIQFDAEQSIAPVMADYRSLAEVQYVCPNALLRLEEAPDDSLFSRQWALPKLTAILAWDVAHGDTGVFNSVIDDGVDWAHPDISANLWMNRPEDINGNGRFDSLPAPNGDLDGIDQDGNGYADDVIGWDFVDYDPNPMPTGNDAHGTHCWGTLNAVTNNRIGVAGPVWNSRSFAVRCGSGGSVYLSAVISAIYYTIEENGWAISMSFGGSSPYEPLRQACSSAWNAGLTLFASAGTGGTTEPRYPACYDNVEAVAASDTNDRHCAFTGFGTWIDVCAPGEDILSTVPRRAGYYAVMDGTSMACPLAAGVCCWIKSLSPGLSNQQVLDTLHWACDSMPDSLYRIGLLGAGRVSMGNVVRQGLYCDLRLTGWRFREPSGNGRPDPGETVSLIITYRNASGWRDATDVSATLGCAGDGITVVKPAASFPDIPAGSSSDCSADSFVIALADTAPPQDVRFRLTVAATPGVYLPETSLVVRCGDPRVFIVDDDAGSTYETYYTAACDSNRVLYHTWSVQAGGSPTAETLRHYPVVVWFTGDDSTTTLTTADIASLTSYLNSGGNLMLSGQNVAQDLNGDPFLPDYLHASFVDDSTGRPYLVGLDGDPIADGDTMVAAGAGGAGNARSMDGIRPVNGAFGSAYYRDYGDTTVYALVRYQNSYGVVFFSVPFEAVYHMPPYLSRWEIIRRVLLYFGEHIPHVGARSEPPTSEVRLPPFILSPSPTRGRVFIRLSSGLYPAPTYLRVFDVSGRNVHSAACDGEPEITLDFGRFGPGVYLVQLATPDGSFSAKAVVTR